MSIDTSKVADDDKHPLFTRTAAALIGSSVNYRQTLFVADLDGTLLDSDARLNLHAAKRLNDLIDRGVNFTVATARALPSIASILSNVPLVLPIIEQNGVLIRDPRSAEILGIQAFAPSDSAALLDIFGEFDIDPAASVLEHGQNRLFYNRLSTPGGPVTI